MTRSMSTSYDQVAFFAIDLHGKGETVELEGKLKIAGREIGILSVTKLRRGPRAADSFLNHAPFKWSVQKKT